MIASPTALGAAAARRAHDEREAGEADSDAGERRAGDPLAGEETQRTPGAAPSQAMIAATLESIRVSASVTTPTPKVSSAAPSAAQAASSRRVTRRLCPRSASTAASSSPASANRAPAERNGGIVSTITLMPRYVEPQTR